MIAKKGSEAVQSEMKVKKITCPLGKPKFAEVYKP